VTREEASKILHVLWVYYHHYLTEKEAEAVDMAIEALSKMEVIQDVIDMPFEWEQDDRHRYARVVNIVKRDLLQDCCAGSYCPDCGAKMEGIKRWVF